MRNMTGKKKLSFRKLVSSFTAALTATVILTTGAVPTVNSAQMDIADKFYANAHVQNLGWMSPDTSSTYIPGITTVTSTGKIISTPSTGEEIRDVKVGTTGRSLRLESLKLGFTAPDKPEYGGIMVNAHVSNIGWQGFKTAPCGSTVTVGTTGRGLAIEAIQIKLYGKLAQKYSIKYKVHSAYIGWGPTCVDGQVAGTVGEGRRAEAVYITLVPHK